MTTVTDDNDIRAELREFCLGRAEGPYREHIREFFRMYDGHNAAFWNGELSPAPIQISPPSSQRAWADASTYSAFGCRLQIRLRPAVVDGTWPTGKFQKNPKPYWRMRPGHALADRYRFISDVVAYEMVHLRMYATGQAEACGKCGHAGPFIKEANRVGALLGVPPVTAYRLRKGGPRDLPLSGQWPHCVRPGGEFGPFYGTLWERVGEEREPDTRYEKLCLTWQAFRQVWEDPRTTGEDKARFLARFRPHRGDASDDTRLVTADFDMGLAA